MMLLRGNVNAGARRNLKSVLATFGSQGRAAMSTQQIFGPVPDTPYKPTSPGPFTKPEVHTPVPGPSSMQLLHDITPLSEPGAVHFFAE